MNFSLPLQVIIFLSKLYYAVTLEEQLLKISFIFSEKAKSYYKKSPKIELFINFCTLLYMFLQSVYIFINIYIFSLNLVKFNSISFLFQLIIFYFFKIIIFSAGLNFLESILDLLVSHFQLSVKYGSLRNDILRNVRKPFLGLLLQLVDEKDLPSNIFGKVSQVVIVGAQFLLSNLEDCVELALNYLSEIFLNPSQTSSRGKVSSNHIFCFYILNI